MVSKHEAPEPQTKVSGTWRTPGKGPHDDVEVRVAYGLVHAPATALFLEGVELREFRITSTAEGARIMLKAKRGKMHVVAFFNADSWRDAIVLALTSLDSQHVVWKPDQWPPDL